jgi:hypothetical protein
LWLRWERRADAVEQKRESEILAALERAIQMEVPSF